MKDILKVTSWTAFLFGIAFLLGTLYIQTSGGIPQALATHSGPTQQVDGTHTEGDGFLPNPVLMGGDDGTDIKNIAVDTDGNIQVDVLSSVQTAGVLQGNSPTTLEGITTLFNAGDITATNFGASTAITVAGTGTITQVCLAWTMGTLNPVQTHSVFFFDADPAIAENVADLTAAESLLVIGEVAFVAADYPAEFATAETACKATDIKYVTATHAALHLTGVGAGTDEIVKLRLWYRRDS